MLSFSLISYGKTALQFCNFSELQNIKPWFVYPKGYKPHTTHISTETNLAALLT